MHYLALIEQKINALDQAAPLAGWRLPEEFTTLRRLLEARMGKQGKREFAQVLRLIEAFKSAGMVTTEKIGRVRHCRLGTRRLEDVTAWIAKYQALLEARLHRLGQFLDRKGDLA